MRFYKFIKAFIVIVLLAVIISTFCYGMVYVKHSPNKISEKDKAIILVPGLLGSCIIDDNNIFWDPINANRDSQFSILEKLKLLQQDEEGNSLMNTRAPNMKDDFDLVGGAMNLQKDWYYNTKERFQDEYDVVMFQFDWRIDNKISAQQLDTFIEENEWEEVILVAHSMGGIVTSTYLTMGEEQRNKVSLHISLGTPYFGIAEIVGLFENGYWPFADNSYIEFFKPFIQDMAVCMPSLYQMLPSKKLLEGSFYKEGENGYNSFIRVENAENEYLENFEDIKSFFETRPWSKYQQTKGKIGQVKNMLYDAFQFQQQFLYEENGIEKHITEKVDSYYFAGSKMNIGSQFYYRENGDVERIICNEPFHDGTVSTNSALINHNPDNKRYFLYENYDHLELVFNDEKDNLNDPMDKVYSIIEENNE